VALASQGGLRTNVDQNAVEEDEEVKAQVLTPPPPHDAAKETEDISDDEGDSTTDIKAVPRKPKPAPHMAVSKLPQAPLQKRTFGASSPSKGEGTLL
jgi:hypothetical protein